MAVYRVERTRDYTVMSNFHLRDANLTLKAKGLLSMMLSLPDQWNYSTRGLASICKEGVDSIGRTVRELEAAGYIIRRQLRGEKGRIIDTEYVIYEQPQNRDTPPETPNPGGPDNNPPSAPHAPSAPAAPRGQSAPTAQASQTPETLTDAQSPRPVRPDTAASDARSGGLAPSKPPLSVPDAVQPDMRGPYALQPDTAFPHTENPYVAEPDTDAPHTENRPELNIKQDNKKRSITHQKKKDSFFPSGVSATGESGERPPERPVEGRKEILAKRAQIKAQIDYEYIVNKINRKQIDEMVEIMLEVSMRRSLTIKIGRDCEYPTALVQERFERLDSSHIEKILEGMDENATRVWNTKAYLMAALFNAPSTTTNHYAMLAAYDMRGL